VDRLDHRLSAGFHKGRNWHGKKKFRTMHCKKGYTEDARCKRFSQGKSPPMRPIYSMLFLTFMAACATPRQQCETKASADLTDLDRTIATAQANVDRGYAIRHQRTPQLVFAICHDAERLHYQCFATVFYEKETPVSIDVAAEQAKIKALKSRRASVSAQAEAATTQCIAAYPET
jgi:hypothetical protein